MVNTMGKEKRCPVSAQCGGCTWIEKNYAEQIAEKEYSSDDDYYEALQEKMTQEVLKRKK